MSNLLCHLSYKHIDVTFLKTVTNFMHEEELVKIHQTTPTTHTLTLSFQNSKKTQILFHSPPSTNYLSSPRTPKFSPQKKKHCSTNHDFILPTSSTLFKYMYIYIQTMPYLHKNKQNPFLLSSTHINCQPITFSIMEG